jgi:cytochrome b subunit of formate dehydrogenase
VEEGSTGLKRFFRRSAGALPKAGKYPLDHKLYHNTITVVTVAAIATGVLMMFRVDTPFWNRNPYILSDGTWGWVYVVHGLAGVTLITMVMAHIYFAIRPEKWWITLSMIKGWIRRKDFEAHHDPKRWVVTGGAPARSPRPADASRSEQPVA